MEFSLKEGLGFAIGLLCTALVIYALYNFGFFEGIGQFIEGCV